jgi:hypothetical protein
VVITLVSEAGSSLSIGLLRGQHLAAWRNPSAARRARSRSAPEASSAATALAGKAAAGKKQGQGIALKNRRNEEVEL